MLIHWQYNQKQVIGFNEQIYWAALNKIQNTVETDKAGMVQFKFTITCHQLI